MRRQLLVQHLAAIRHNKPNAGARIVQGITNYQWAATTLEGFIQQLAVGYVARKYHFYVTGRVPQRLTAAEHDRRMLAKFQVARSKWSRYRRTRRKGPDGRPLANVQYLRYCDFWVLLSTAARATMCSPRQAKSNFSTSAAGNSSQFPYSPPSIAATPRLRVYYDKGQKRDVDQRPT